MFFSIWFTSLFEQVKLPAGATSSWTTMPTTSSSDGSPGCPVISRYRNPK
jgi:hypothetical protein